MKKEKAFSKMAIKAVFILSISVIIYCLLAGSVLALLDKVVPETLLYTAIGAAFACTGTCYAFYVNKAKAENTKGGITYDSAMSPEKPEENGG